MKKNSNLPGVLMLLVASLIWGSSFVAQRLGADALPVFTFTAVRSFIGGICLIPVSFLIKDAAPAQPVTDPVRSRRPGLLLAVGGIVCGVILALASGLQQYGVGLTSAGKAGFITTLYIVIVPLLGLFIGQRQRPAVWASVVIATGGLYLLCVTESFSIGRGDFFVLLCALVYSFHILTLGYFSPRVNPVKLSCIQMFTAGVVCTPFALIIERPTAAQVLSAWLPLVFVGVLSSGVAFTLQAVAQKRTTPAVCSLVMCLESVFAVLSGWLFLHETLTLREGLGCLLVFTAVVVTQLPAPERKKRTRSDNAPDPAPDNAPDPAPDPDPAAPTCEE